MQMIGPLSLRPIEGHCTYPCGGYWRLLHEQFLRNTGGGLIVIKIEPVCVCVYQTLYFYILCLYIYVLS